MRKTYLLTPGPTPLPPQVCEALARPIIHHRTPQFQAILKEAVEGLKYVFQTKSDVFILSSSGTGAMEAAVANLLSPGDTAITVEGGKFGERWTELCYAYSVHTEIIKVEWSRAVKAEEIKAKLKATKAKVVFTTLCETSTGVTTDIKSIAEAVKNSEAVLVVDAISGLGVIDLKTDEWAADVVVSGSQKGLMLPPGLGFISISQKAWKLIDTARSPRYYFDLRAAKKAWAQADTPFTTPVSLVVALNAALKMLKEEGLENVFTRCRKMAEAVRAAASALGLKLYADASCASEAITAINVPFGLDGEKLVKTMRDIYGVTIAGGQAELKGKVFRIASMGYLNEFDIILALSCLEKVLYQMGYKFELGAGVRAAQEVFLK
ncbi:MAG: class V aminotransferase [Omnitrophica WOR_2 bacterium RIFCSPLOWO2_12_FULL_46_30]|nr:MAG: class V aminotransferase [Omnitrophica WOR_2 bacterium RIFCSPHIGHO2_02_FULL_46_37]OGX50808.1 MAG: class V aminotransferase [Omnitrophica WOR_2 bacterium RIFCSPLOWO2_12_FULL_46_30]